MEKKYILSKPRYEILDALRGVAAIIVLVYHFCEVLGGGITSFHGYLAVDFFYILSGFVIGYAYDDRWKSASNPQGMTLWAFFKRRLIRLHPLVIFGTLIGVLLLYFGMSDELPQIREAHWPAILACIVFACIMIPTPHSLDVRGWQEFNSFNGNSWTLYYEYLANIIYALVIRRFSKPVLSVFVGAAALLTIAMGLNFDFWGIMDARPEYQCYTFIGGWSLDPDQLLLGFTRLLFPFFAGLLMSRCLAGKNVAGKDNHGFLVSSLLLAAVLLVPTLHGLPNGIFEVCCVLIVFPVVVLLGARGKVSGRIQALCKWLGDISYPLYITHYPIVFTLCMGWKSNNPTATSDQVFFVAICGIALSIMVAWASLKLYDEPVRKWLTEKLQSRRK